MKIKLHLFLALTAAMLFFGCASSNSEKLPAGDIDIFRLYKAEIATLHNPALRTDSELKYEAALTLYKNIDFSYARETYLLEKIFAARDARLSKEKNDKQTIIFLYRYKNKRVRFVFIRYNNSIIHSECTDQI